MHYIPHQRSLPPLPSTSNLLTPHSWQRSSLPARSRPRTPPPSWQRSSLPAHHFRPRPTSYYNPETSSSSKDFLRDSPAHSYQYSRSSSSFNLNERLPTDSFSGGINSRVSVDDLTPLNPRSHFQSLDRRFMTARSSHDIHRWADEFTDVYHEPMSNGIIGGGRFSNRPYHRPDPIRNERRDFDLLEPYHGHYNSHGNLNHVNSIDMVQKSYSDVSPSYMVRRSYTPRSNHSRHGSADNMSSPPDSLPQTPRSKTSSIKRDLSYERRSFGSRASSRKDMNSNDELNHYQDPPPNFTQVQKPTKFVYLKQPTPNHCTQVLATLVVSLGPLCAGLGKGYSSPALASMAALSAQGHHFAISKDQGSWVASLSLLGAFFGSLPAGMSIQWGRKRVLCVVALPFAMSWILTVLATNVYMLYAAAILGGICTAIISVVTPVYISEIAHPDIRGCLCSFSKMNSNVGMLISYLFGAFMNWRQLATVTAIAPACLFVCTLVIPETPSFLLYRGRDAEALEALKWLRGSSTDVSREMTTMKANIATLRRHQQQNKPLHKAPRELVRPLFITCGLMVFQKFSGANAFNFYAVPILAETFVGLNPYRAAVVVAFVQICAGMASSALVDTVGRRPLLVFSNMLMSAALAAFGCYVYLKGLDQNEDIFSKQEWKESDWVPLFCILVIEIAYALGVSPISWLYIGELFPLKHRGYGAIAASVSYACSFASVKTFVDLQNWLGLYGAFWFYSTIAGVALIFTLLFVPETKGKSLQEMQTTEKQKETLI